jgi:tetratricopeptide (TPR) repeat protein
MESSEVKCYAVIKEFSAFPCEEEYLININNFFMIKNIFFHNNYTEISIETCSLEAVKQNLFHQSFQYENILKNKLKIEYDLDLFYFAKILTFLNRAEEVNFLGLSYTFKVEYDKALESFNKSLEIHLNTAGYVQPDNQTVIIILVVYIIRRENEKAFEYCNMALQIRLNSVGENHPDTANSYNNIGRLYSFKGENDKAIEYYDKALQIQLKTVGENHPDTPNTYNNGLSYDAIKEYKKSLIYYNKAIQIQLKTLSENLPETANSYCNIGCSF